MAFMAWSHELDTGIDIVDSQHKRIIEYINALHDAQQSQDKSKAGDVINELVDYTVSHFAFEESLMENADYPFLVPHQKVHGLFIKKVSSFVERFTAGEDVTDELLTMLQKWLVNHIKTEDGDYKDAVLTSMKKMKKKSGWLSRTLEKFFG